MPKIITKTGLSQSLLEMIEQQISHLGIKKFPLEKKTVLRINCKKRVSSEIERSQGLPVSRKFGSLAVWKFRGKLIRSWNPIIVIVVAHLLWLNWHVDLQVYKLMNRGTGGVGYWRDNINVSKFSWVWTLVFRMPSREVCKASWGSCLELLVWT